MIDYPVVNLLLADDDEDDCLLFSEALDEIAVPTKLSIVHNGEQLLRYLNTKKNELPHILFLDLNMPRINGLQCLKEVKEMTHLRQIRVVIFSTSYHQDIANQLFENGAIHYIQKPGDFKHLKLLIEKVLLINRKEIVRSKFNSNMKDRKKNYVLLIHQILS